MSLERRIQKLVVEIRPLRDPSCLQKTMTDRAIHAKLTKWITRYVKDFNHEQQYMEIEKIEQLLSQ
jgi:hypothetical protein